jgi:integrase
LTAWRHRLECRPCGVLWPLVGNDKRRTKATLIYRKTKNLRAVQRLPGHSDIASTVRYLGIEVDDALAISEQVEI